MSTHAGAKTINALHRVVELCDDEPALLRQDADGWMLALLWIALSAIAWLLVIAIALGITVE